MSLAYEKLIPTLIEQPITAVNIVDRFAVTSGGNKISYKAVNSTNISSSSISWSAPPPSSGVIVNRNIKATVPIRLTFTGIITTTDNAFNAPTSLLNAGKDAPRFLPLSGAMSELQVSINTTSVSIPMSDVIHPLTRYNICPELRAKEYSLSPCYPDCSYNYDDLVGTAKNPLGNNANTSDGDAIQRGGFPFTIVSNTAVVPTTAGVVATAVVDMVITEALYLSPMFFGKSSDNIQGFYNVTSFDVYMSFLAQAGFRMWSHANTVSTVGANSIRSNITGITASFNNFNPAFSYSQTTPLMQFEYISPNLLTKQHLGPNIPVTYPFFQVQRFPTDIPPITYASGSTQVNSSSIQLSSIPRRMYFFVRPNNNTLQSRADITDCYLAIKNMQIQWANQNTVLGSASPQQLYAMNLKSGSSQDWISWSGEGVYNSAFPPNVTSAKYGGVGGIMCLTFGEQIQLDADEAPSLSGQFQLQITANVQNMNSSGAWDNLPLTMYVITVEEGVFTIPSANSAQQQIAVLSKEDILDAARLPGISYNQVERVNGGDFLSSLGHFAGRVHDYAKSNKLASKGLALIPHPIGQLASSVADVLGYGAEGGQAIQVAGLQGGMRMDKASLKSRLG